MNIASSTVRTLEQVWWSGDGLWTQVSLSAAAEIVPLLERVVAGMAGQGYPPRTCREMRLALEEAIVNGLRHGNGGDPTRRVRVRYRVQPQAVLADVEDEGPGFDPSAIPDPTAPENLEKPTGRGLLLMRHCTTWLCYHGRCNRLSLCKYRPLTPAC
jgi:serine/threonine-protein kinase RsbW